MHVATPPVSIIPDPSALQLLAMVTQPPQTQHLSQNMSLPSPPPLSQHPYPTSNESNHPSLSFYIHDRAPQATTKSMIAPVQHTLTFLTTLSHNTSDPHHHQPHPFRLCSNCPPLKTCTVLKNTRFIHFSHVYTSQARREKGWTTRERRKRKQRAKSLPTNWRKTPQWSFWSFAAHVSLFHLLECVKRRSIIISISTQGVPCTSF